MMANLSAVSIIAGGQIVFLDIWFLRGKQNETLSGGLTEAENVNILADLDPCKM